MAFPSNHDLDPRGRMPLELDLPSNPDLERRDFLRASSEDRYFNEL